MEEKNKGYIDLDRMKKKRSKIENNYFKDRKDYLKSMRDYAHGVKGHTTTKSEYGVRKGVKKERGEDYLLGLLEISEEFARGEETPFNLLKKLEKLNERFPIFAEEYSKQSFDLRDRLRLREEEGRYNSLL